MTMTQTTVAGYVFPVSDHGIDCEHEVLVELKACAKKEKKLFQRIQNADGSDMRLVRAHAYLSSFSSRFVAMIERAKELKPCLRLPLSSYKKLALSLSLFHPIVETTEFWEVPRSSGNGYRRLHDFDILNQTAQHMVMRVISAVFKPRPHQFGVAGKGQTKAIQLIKQKVAEGFVHIRKLDVSNFFGSFSRDGLYALLSIPKPVIDNVVMPDNLQLKGKKACKSKSTSLGDVSLSTSPCASLPVLPQGSLHAPILAEHAVSLMSIMMPDGVVIVIYVDDIFLMAKSADDLETATHALSFAYGGSPAGTFVMKVSEETLQTGVVFLGYLLRQLPGCNLAVQPSHANLQEFSKNQKTLRTAISKASKNGFAPAIEAAIAEYYIYMRSWVAAFQAADNYQDFVFGAQQRMVLACEQHGVSPSVVKEIAKAHFSHTTTKVKSNGSYKWQVKIKDIDPVFAAISQAHDFLP